MPSTATITAFNTFVADTKARSSEVNTNFDHIRGHILPTETNTVTSANNIYDSGATDARWNNGWFNNPVYAHGIRLIHGQVFNMGISFATNTFTVHGQDGTALSSTNSAWVVLESKASPGQKVIYSMVANQTFVDNSITSDAKAATGNRFGITVANTTTAAWAQDIPFYLYAVGNNNEDTIQMMISRDPSKHLSPTVTSIAAPDDLVGDTQNSFYSFSAIDETLYDLNPCANLGGFRMQNNTAGAWVVQAISDLDGIGNFHDATWFNLPAGVNGAQDGKFLSDNGGTAPVFSTNDYKYRVFRNGHVRVQIALDGDGGVDGSGAVDSLVFLPYSGAQEGPSTDPYVLGTAFTRSVGAGIDVHFLTGTTGSDIYIVDSGHNTISHSQWTNGDRSINAEFTYSVFSE